MTADVPHLETDRLRLRGWRESDFAPLAAFYAADPGATYVGGAMPPEDAWRRLATFIGHWHLKGYGPFAVEENATGRWCGWCALWQPPEFPEIEMGYTLIAAVRGRGYATEAGRAVKQFAFATLRLPTLVSFIAADNVASQNVAKRLDGRREGDVTIRGKSAQVWRYPPPGGAA